MQHKLPYAIILTSYLAIEAFHVYLVKESSFVLYLVCLFALVRLCAFLVKAKPLLVVLAIFSCAFITANYSNLYTSNNLALENNKALASNINSYSSKYWTNQNTFKELVNKQENLITNTKELPNVFLVVSLIILIELSLVYLVATLKTKKAINSKSKFITNVTKPSTNVTNITKNLATKPLQGVTKAQNCNNLNSNAVAKSKIVTNIRAFKPAVTNTVADCNKTVTSNVTSVKPSCNSVTKQQDLYKLSKQEFIQKYNIKESYYRVLKSRLSKNNNLLKTKETNNKEDTRLLRLI